MSNGGNKVPRITQAEHIGPDDTGDNISAKRVAHYGWDYTNSVWRRIGAVESSDTPGVFGLVVLNADGTALSTGGSGGGSSDGAYDFMDGNDAAFMDGNDMAFMSG